MTVWVQRQWRVWWRTGRLIGLALLVGLIAMRVTDPAPVEVLRLKTFDLFQRLSPFEHPDKPVLIVDIDEVSLSKLGQWPWPRHYMAKLVGNLANSGVRAIGFDMVFGEKDPTSGANFVHRAFMLTDELKAQIEKLPSTDEFFGQIIRQSGVVVLGQAADFGKPPVENPLPPRTTTVATFNGDPRPYLQSFGYLIRNIPELEQNAPGIGMFVLSADRDDTIRRVPAVVRVGNDIFPTLALEMLRIATKSQQYIITRAPDDKEAGIMSVAAPPNVIPTDREGRLWVRFAKHDRSLYVSAADIILDRFDPKVFDGKLVLVGTSAVGLRDLRTTPVESVIPGVEVHAQLLKSIIAGQHLVRVTSIIEPVEWAVIILTGLLLIALLPDGSALSIVALFSALVAAMLTTSWYLMAHQNFLVDASFPVFSCTLLFVTLVFIKFMREASQRREIRTAFSQYLNPETVNRLADDPSQLKMGGDTREMTFLFSDVHGFTSIAERFKSDPQSLTRLINQLLTPLTARILANHGTIDKYMGDSVMAFWNAPLDDAEHPAHACDAAMDMLRALDELNQRRQSEAAPGATVEPLKVGIGINTGECVVGNMGSEQRFTYTVLGDAVNLASRLESQSRTYGVDNVLGDVTAARVSGRYALLQLDLIAVKGKDEAVRIFTIAGDKAFAEGAEFHRWQAAHDALLAAYRARQWDTAEARLAECRALSQGRIAAFYDLYAERIDEFRRAPPETDWDGVYRAVNK